MKSRWERRERKQQAERKRMKKSGRSVFTIIQVQVERAKEIKKDGQ